jgi:signal peptidase I
MEIIDFNVEPNQGETSDSVQKKEDGAPQENGQKFSWKDEVFSWLLTFVVAIAVALLIKNYVIINANVPTGSMENTIMPGDDLFGFRLSYLLGKPERGDIVIFKFPDDESQKFIKRIIGLPGEKVVIEDGKIYINDSEVPLEETYLKEEWVVATGPYEFNVPEDCYFVMGDNRNDSNDARFWDNTYVTSKEIIGKAEFVYYPFNHIKSLR